VLGNIFQTGRLVMSQVSNLLGLEPYLIQNWVKRGFLAPPQKKLYTRRQFCRLCIINMLKDTLRLERIAALISYVNGMLDDESDDTVADLITDGCNMGVKSLNRYLNQYKAAEEKVKDITKRLINLEEKLAVDIRQYL